MKMEKVLPEGIVMEILTWLPVKDIARFRCVSKKWCNHLANPDFIKLHGNRSTHVSLILTKKTPKSSQSADPDPDPDPVSFPSLNCNNSGDDITFYMSKEFRCPFPYWRSYISIIGICNGLFCIQSDPETIYVWNPITDEYKKLPQVPDEPQIAVISIDTYGFGYDYKTGDYKVVKILTHRRGRGSKVWIYTLGTNSWRKLNVIPYEFNLLKGLRDGVFFNGVVHWLVHPLRVRKAIIRVIISFDVGEEKFREIKLPLPLCGAPEGEDYYKTSIGLLDADLCLSWNVGDGSVDVWVMKNYGVVESWTRLFSVSRLKEDIEYLRPVRSLENGDILLLGQPLKPSTQYNGDLILYSPMSGHARFLDTSAYQKLEDVCTYVGTLVSV